MARWIFKAAVQRAIGLLPRRHVWNGLFQEYITRSDLLDTAVFEHHLSLDARHLGYYAKHAPKRADDTFTAFELGTGWHPVLPVAFYLCGASQVWTCDITPMMTLRRVEKTLKHFIDCHDQGRLQDLLPGVRTDRVEHLRTVAGKEWASVEQLLEQLNIHVLVGDAAQSKLPAESVDLICSNVALEYITEEPLGRILGEFRRVASPGAVMSHDIDMADQYSYLDRSITPYNFLRFSDSTWKLINNPMIPLSRLRISDFRRLFAEAGFEIVEEDTQLDEKAQLDRVPLAERFRHYSVDDLLVLRAWIVARPVA